MRSYYSLHPLPIPNIALKCCILSSVAFLSFLKVFNPFAVNRKLKN